MQRGGAKSDDILLVTGSFGGSLRRKHFDFTPRVQEALYLNAHYKIHAAQDVSDGLSLDISKLVQESGCGAQIDLSEIPISDDAYQMSASTAKDLTPLERALGDGEDFELILAVPAVEAERLLTVRPLEIPLTRIGECVSQPGLFCRDLDGQVRKLAPSGYQH